MGGKMQLFMNSVLDKDLVDQCRNKLLQMKQDLLNRQMTSQLEFVELDKTSGDEIDQTVAQISEDQYLISQDRTRRQLLEIEAALARIQLGQFGICEETGELVERERILAIPYTRLSIEGAEIREAQSGRVRKSVPR